VRIPAVCLEHGKDEPSPRVYYEMAPMESVVKDPAIYELCTMLGNGEVDQRVAQAATWHLANGMTWQQLAAKRVRHLNGSISSFFTRAEVLTAVKAVRVAQYRAKLRAKQSESQTSYKEGGE